MQMDSFDLRQSRTLHFGACLVWVSLAAGCGHAPPSKASAKAMAPVANPDATWPWPSSKLEHLRSGVTRRVHPNPTDGSRIELIEFDFRANPKLRFEIYDQDHHDALPYDDRADFFDQNVAAITRELGKRVVFASNGLFHGYLRTPGSPPHGYGTHIGLNVSKGVVRYNVGSPRWAFGAKTVHGRQVFSAILSPDKHQMSKTFDEGAVGAQLLIKNGKPMKLQAFPQPNSPAIQRPLKTTQEEAGQIPEVDFMRTSRVSIGWTDDSSKLYFLLVNEPDNEVQSKLILRGRMAGNDGGWTLADLQNFWLKFGIDHAINSDGGIVAQWIVKMPDETYEFQPPRWIAPPPKVKLKPDFSNAIKGGGTLMNFVISE